MTPMWAADQWFQTAIYYEDPDKNIIELNVDNFTNLWAVTEGLKELPSQLHVFIDPEKLIAARKAGATCRHRWSPSRSPSSWPCDHFLHVS
jgi:catechol 2,3-dioxygenase